MVLALRFSCFVRLFILVAASASLVLAQIPADEHASHHPGQAPGGPPAATQAGEATGAGLPGPAGPGSGGPGGSMGGAGGMMGGAGGMGGMMEQMGAPKPKDLYPSLMELPDLPMERRQEIEAQAHERMQSGVGILSEGLDQLSTAAPTDNYQAMEEATAIMREGMAQFESGLAAHRAIAEGKAPRNVALRWFKREMNLFPASAAVGSEMFGLAPRSFHYVVIALLGSFSIAVVWMYFFKMRRAGALLERLSVANGTGSVGAASLSPDPTEQATSAPTQPAAEKGAPSIGAIEKPKRWKGTLRVARIFEETPNVKTFRLITPEGGPLSFTYRPGQFLTLTVTPEGKPVKRSYTIASSPTQRDYVELTVKREEMGLVSRYLHDSVSEGDTLEIAAPSGKFTYTGEESSSIVLIAGGVGVTPMMSVLRYLTDRAWPGAIYLVYSCRTSNDLIFREEIEYRRKRYPNLHVTLALSREENPKGIAIKGRITGELLTGQVPDLKSRRVHICGPQVMMDAVKETLFGLGLSKDQVKTEAFGPAKGTGKPTGIADKTAPPAAQNTARSLATVSFARSGKSAPLPPDKSVLDVADETGVEIDNSCREGTCGTCTVKLLSGEVTMAVEDGLEPEDKAQSIILACQAKSQGDISVDA